MAFRNFVYAKDQEDLSFLSNEPSPGFDYGGSPKPVLFVVHPGSVATRMKNMKCKTRRGSSRPPVKRKLAFGSSFSHVTRAKTSTSKDDVPFLTISDDDEGLSDRSCELLKVIEKLRGECNVIKERERAQEEESESLHVKCEVSMSDFEKNPTTIALREKISTLSTEAILLTLESQIVSLEAEKARLEAVKVSLRKEVDDVKRDRMEVVSKVVSYAAMELIHSDDLGSLEPFDLSKVKGHRPSYKKELNQAGNDLVTATFPWLLEFLADPSAPVEVLLSKKPSSLQRPAPSKTQALVSSSLKSISSSIPGFSPMSPLADAFVVKPLSS
nr:hypothetical protein [Tanacetum cinerariifolium]